MAKQRDNFLNMRPYHQIGVDSLCIPRSRTDDDAESAVPSIVSVPQGVDVVPDHSCTTKLPFCRRSVVACMDLILLVTAAVHSEIDAESSPTTTGRQ